MDIKVALVGCGQIADGHVGEIQKISNATIVGVCDLEPIMAEQLALRFAVPDHYCDFSEMLMSCRPDVVHICTPPASHLSLVKQSVDAGCHVYVEKPLALSYEQSVELINYVEAANLKITIGHNSEFEPPALEMRKLVAGGMLGDPVHIESWFGYNLSGPFGQAILGSPEHWVHRLPGKLFQNNINHMLNKVIEFLDDDRPEVIAKAWRSDTAIHYGDIRDDLCDELRVMIRGETVSAYGTFTSTVKPVAQFARVYGTKNIIEMDFNSRTVVVDSGVTLPSAIGRLAAGFSKSISYGKSSLRNAFRFLKNDYHFFSGMNVLIRQFYQSITENRPVPISSRNMLRIAWIMDEIFSQIEIDRGAQ